MSMWFCMSVVGGEGRTDFTESPHEMHLNVRKSNNYFLKNACVKSSTKQRILIASINAFEAQLLLVVYSQDE